MLVTGCASHTRVVSQREVRQSSSDPSVTVATTSGGTTTVTTPGTGTQSVVSERTTVRERGEERGFLSGTVHVIGQILALPFKLIGGLFEVIF